MNQGRRELSFEECVHVSGGDGTGFLGSGTRQGDHTPPPPPPGSDGTDTNDTGGTMGSGN
jgi:hypothetical protein